MKEEILGRAMVVMKKEWFEELCDGMISKMLRELERTYPGLGMTPAWVKENFNVQIDINYDRAGNMDAPNFRLIRTYKADIKVFPDNDGILKKLTSTGL